MSAGQERQSPPEAGNGAQAGGLSAEQVYSGTALHALPRPKSGTVAAAILEALEGGRALTTLDCWRDFGTSRLAGYVCELRGMGWPIVSETVAVPARAGRTAHVSRYVLAQVG